MSSIYNFGWLGIAVEREHWQAARMSDEEMGCRRYVTWSEANETIEYRKKKMEGIERPFVWDAVRKLHDAGQLPWNVIPVPRQDTGNCVAHGVSMAGLCRQILEIAMFGEEESARWWYEPWIYAVSRNQIIGGMTGAGSTGAAGARAVNEYGVLFSDDSGVPDYPGTSDRWGSRRNAGNLDDAEYSKFKTEAKDNPCQVVRVESVEQARELLEMGTTLTIASGQGWQVREHQGYHVGVRRGRWMHQMSITDSMKAPFRAMYIQNSWGPNAHMRPLHGETPGGFWARDEDIEAVMSSRYCEVYGYFDFRGSPGEPNWNIFE